MAVNIFCNLNPLCRVFSLDEKENTLMKLNDYIRMMAGTMILVSLTLAHFHSTNWLWLTAFVGANLFQSSLTKWCLAEDILKKIGVKS